MRFMILGVSNLLLKDEGIGVHVARALQAMSLPDNGEVLDRPPRPSLPRRGADKVVVNAVRAGGEPGSSHLATADIAAQPGALISAHQMSLILGVELSLELRETSPKIVQAMLMEVRDYGFG